VARPSSKSQQPSSKYWPTHQPHYSHQTQCYITYAGIYISYESVTICINRPTALKICAYKTVRLTGSYKRWALHFYGLLRKAGWFIADISGQRIGPISKDQGARPKRRWHTDLACATTQSIEDLNYTVVKVRNLAFYARLSHAAFNGKVNCGR
jgi:hypothetical protein